MLSMAEHQGHVFPQQANYERVEVVVLDSHQINHNDDGMVYWRIK